MKIEIIGVIFTGLGCLISVVVLVYFFIDRNKNRVEGKLKTSWGNANVIIGTSTFKGVNIPLQYQGVPIIKIENKIIDYIFWKRSKLILSLDIFDGSGNLVARMDRNSWKLNPDKLFSKKISRKKLEIIDKKGNMICKLIANNDGSVKLNGIFYLGKVKVEATDEGLIFPGNNKFIGCSFGNSNVGISIN